VKFLNDGVSDDTVSYLTFGLSLLLVFRVGQSYNRYNDARVKWGMMVNRTRDISRQFFCYFEDKALAKRANKWIISYVYACKQSLRWKTQCNELSHTLSEDELAGLNGASHMPVYCMEQIANCINEALKRRMIDTMQVKMMDENITGFEDFIGASERLLKTPVPYGLVLHLRWIMIFYIVTVPLYLAGPGELDWGAVPVTVIFAYTLTGLEDLSQSIENPFRQAWHCLPIDGICAAIRGNLLEIESRNSDAAPAKVGSGGSVQASAGFETGNPAYDGKA
jgi:putative membrane protein